MKKLILTLTAAILLAPAALVAQRIATQTHFKDERITGVSASSAFDVVLVKSDRTKAVVEINDRIEPYLRISRSADGVVSVGMRDMGNREWRNFNRLPEKERTMRLTLYLPTLNTVRLTGATDLIPGDDSFPGKNVDIQLTGASDIKGSLNIQSERVKLQASGASDASLTLTATRDLVVVASGASDIEIEAFGLTYCKLGASGASDVTIKGNGEKGDWTASGASGIVGNDFATRDLSVNASGASSIRCNASETLTTKTSGASSVRYRGNPRRIDNSNDAVRPM